MPGKILPGGSRFHEGDATRIFCRRRGGVKGGLGKRAKGRVRQITKAQWEKADISAPRMSDVNLTPSKFLPLGEFLSRWTQ